MQEKWQFKLQQEKIYANFCTFINFSSKAVFVAYPNPWFKHVLHRPAQTNWKGNRHFSNKWHYNTKRSHLQNARSAPRFYLHSAIFEVSSTLLVHAQAHRERFLDNAPRVKCLVLRSVSTICPLWSKWRKTIAIIVMPTLHWMQNRMQCKCNWALLDCFLRINLQAAKPTFCTICQHAPILPFWNSRE